MNPEKLVDIDNAISDLAKQRADYICREEATERQHEQQRRRELGSHMSALVRQYNSAEAVQLERLRELYSLATAEDVRVVRFGNGEIWSNIRAGSARELELAHERHVDTLNRRITAVEAAGMDVEV